MSTTMIPGEYPQIVKKLPKIGGENNLGVGIDSNGKKYVLKGYARVCVAEFIGAAVCKALGVRHALPHIVKEVDLFGTTRFLFGSAIEPDLLQFDQSSVVEWQAVVAELEVATVFTVILAVDLALGNDDRHATNWLVESKNPAVSRPWHTLISMDFSNAWPTMHPPHHPRRHPSENTWGFTRFWEQIGINYDPSAYKITCAKISSLSGVWLAAELAPLIGVWLEQTEVDCLTAWWGTNWQSHMIDVIAALESDGDWQ